MEFILINILPIVIDFIALLFIIFLLSAKTERKLSNILLALYLLFFAIDTSANYVSILIYPISPVAGMLISTLVFLTAPLFYLFIKSSIYRDFKIRKITWLHILPYLVVNIALIPIYYVEVIKQTSSQIDQQQFVQSELIKISYLILHIQYLTYFLLIFLMLKKYRQLLIENFSNPILGNYRWLMQFTILLFADSIISMIKNIILLLNWTYLDTAIDIVLVYILIFMSWLLVKALQNPGLFLGIYSNVQLVKDMIRRNGNNEQLDHISTCQFLESEEDRQFAKELNIYMLSQEPYLNPSLSMMELAHQLNIPIRELSLFINRKMNKHFFDFINEYRIEKAKEILENPENSDMTVLEILYEVGFNSKSSFNTLFKKYTGLTPTEYRKKSWRSAA
jgi:AraC-like DNA-binding protein